MKKVIGLIACFSIAVFAQNEQEQHPSQHSPEVAPPPQYQQQQAYPPPQQAYPPPPPQVVPPPQQYQYPPQQAYPPPQYQYPQQQAYPPPPPQQAVLPQQAQPAPAQENCAQELPGIKFGLRSGLNLSSVSLDDYDFSFGWQIGAVADIGSKYVFFHPGIMFIGKGAEYAKGTMEQTVSMYYIEAPLLLSFKPIPEFRINVGHYVSYGLFGKTETKATINNNTITSKEDSFDSVHDFDFGLSFGIGVEVMQYYVGINYEFGLTDIAQDGRPETKNQMWALTIGYNF